MDGRYFKGQNRRRGKRPRYSEQENGWKRKSSSLTDDCSGRNLQGKKYIVKDIKLGKGKKGKAKKMGGGAASLEIMEKEIREGVWKTHLNA